MSQVLHQHLCSAAAAAGMQMQPLQEQPAAELLQVRLLAAEPQNLCRPAVS